MAINKAELITQVENAKGLYVLGLGSTCLLSHKDAPNILRESHVEFGGQKQTFRNMAGQLECNTDRQWILEEFHKIFLRFYIRETFEIILDYCKHTSQFNLVKSQPWFHFARLIRNCMAHNFKWVFDDKKDKPLLPITLRTSKIELAMEKQPLTLSFFNQSHAWNLHTDMSLFVKNILT